MNAVILGGTKGMGRALARRLVERGDRVFLLGRDPDDLGRSAADLLARSPRELPVDTARLDLADPTTFAPALDAADETFRRETGSGFDTVVITAAQFATQEALEESPARAAALLDVNFTRTVELCEHVRNRLLERGGGTLCVFSSVAGDRGRKPVVLYGASKAGLSAYLEGLDHKFRAAGLRTVCVKPGFVKTGMTAGLPAPPFAGEPDAVAERVVRAIDRGTPVVYAPAMWRWILFVIRRLPRFVMRRIGF